jgi:hypothetical protein
LIQTYKQSFGQFILYGDCIKDFGGENVEPFVHCFKPANVEKIAKLMSSLDYDALTKAFNAVASDEVKEALTDYTKGGKAKLDRCFEGAVLPYLKMWSDFFNESAKKKRGVLIAYT